MSAIPAAVLAVLSTWSDLNTGKIARASNASIPLASPTQDDWGAFFLSIATALEDLDAAVTAEGGNFGEPVADVAALKAVAAASRQDKQLRVVENNGLGQRAIYVFDSASTATGDDLSVIVPTAGSGRWFALCALPFGVIPVYNNSGSPIIKGQPVAVLGYHAASGRPQILAANLTNGIPPYGVAAAAIADGAVGLLVQFGQLTSLALNTSGASLGDPVYLAADGSLSLTTPTDTGLGELVLGTVTALSATGSVYFFPPLTVRFPGIARGKATIPAASTSVVVPVGTRYNGKLAQVSFGSNPGTATLVWAGPVSAGDLTINVDGAPGADLDIFWSILFDQ